MKSRGARMEAALAPLAAVVDGAFSEGRLRGTYGGYTLEARPRKGNPMRQGSTEPAPTPVDMFEVAVTPAPGRQYWECRSLPTTIGTLFAGLAPRLVFRLAGAEFKFVLAGDRAARIAQRIGASAPDPGLEERLKAAGLIDELLPLRWGTHPYLPRVRYTPAERQAFSRSPSIAKDALRAAGHAGFEQAIDEHWQAAGREHPGSLSCEVEMGRAQVPSAEQFRELLEHTVRIAQINAQSNV